MDAGADSNVQDNTGRIPLHAAVASDAQGVIQVSYLALKIEKIILDFMQSTTQHNYKDMKRTNE